MDTVRIDTIIEIVEPAGIYVPETPRISWRYNIDPPPPTVDILLTDIRSGRQTWYRGVPARPATFVLPRPLEAGSYELRVLFPQEFRPRSPSKKISVLSAAELERLDTGMIPHKPEREGPVAVQPEGILNDPPIEFVWHCSDTDVISFHINLVRSEDEKIIRTFAPIAPEKNSMTVPEKDLSRIAPGAYTWWIKAIYADEDIWSEGLDFQIPGSFFRPGIEEGPGDPLEEEDGGSSPPAREMDETSRSGGDGEAPGTMPATDAAGLEIRSKPRRGPRITGLSTPMEPPWAVEWECHDRDVRAFTVTIVRDTDRLTTFRSAGLAPETRRFEFGDDAVPAGGKVSLTCSVFCHYMDGGYWVDTAPFSVSPRRPVKKSSPVRAGTGSRAKVRFNEKSAAPMARFSDVSVSFRRGRYGPLRFSKAIRRYLSGNRKHGFWALKNVSFDLNEGDILGIVGRNGAGKSTLLRILTGVLYPDRGTVEVNGRICSLLSLGTGFLPDLSGRDNIYLNAMYLGLDRKRVDEIIDEIIAFAELGDFIDSQLKHYSSGMKARLGFSVAVHVDPDILVIDEVLSTGDKDFRRKAEEKMLDFMNKAKAIVMVSHNTNLISDFCTRCVHIDQGEVRCFGPTEDVLENYLAS